MANTTYKEAKRVHDSFLAGVEKRCLIWMAKRLPAAINSDHLTVLAGVAMFGAGLCYWNGTPTALFFSIALLVVNWFGDSLDGTLARLRNRQRPRYGFYVDHMVDTIGGLFLMGGLAISGFIDWRIALGMYVAFLMLSVEVYLATYTLGTFQLSFAKFGPTEIRILLAIGNVALWLHSDAWIFGSSYRIFNVGGIIAMVGMSLMLVVSTILNTVKRSEERRVGKECRSRWSPYH